MPGAVAQHPPAPSPARPWRFAASPGLPAASPGSPKTWCGGAWACSWWGELSPSPLSHRVLGAAAFSGAEAGFVPCREALGSPGPLLTKVFLASSQLSVTRLSAEPAWGCEQLGLALLSQREGKIQTKCSNVPPPPCGAGWPRCALCLPRGTNPAPWHRAASAHGDGAGSGAAGGTTVGWLSQPRALPHAWPHIFSGMEPWEASEPWGGAGGPPAGGRWREWAALWR